MTVKALRWFTSCCWKQSERHFKCSWSKSEPCSSFPPRLLSELFPGATELYETVAANREQWTKVSHKFNIRGLPSNNSLDFLDQEYELLQSQGAFGSDDHCLNGCLDDADGGRGQWRWRRQAADGFSGVFCGPVRGWGYLVMWPKRDGSLCCQTLTQDGTSQTNWIRQEEASSESLPWLDATCCCRRPVEESKARGLYLVVFQTTPSRPVTVHAAENLLEIVKKNNAHAVHAKTTSACDSETTGGVKCFIRTSLI